MGDPAKRPDLAVRDRGSVLEGFISTDHAAEMLGCHEMFVLRRIFAGTLPAVQLPNGRFVVPRAAVDDLAATVAAWTVARASSSRGTTAGAG